MPRTVARRVRRAKTQTALDVLKTDHAEVKKLFLRFERLRKGGHREQMQQTAQAACMALNIHAQIEEEVFYPALREAPNADEALGEAKVEHTHVKELVAQLQDSRPGEELFEAQFKVLSEYVQHHVEEEESTLFSKARKANCDLVALGARLLARKEELSAGEGPLDVAALASQQQATRKRNGQRVAR